MIGHALRDCAECGLVTVEVTLDDLYGALRCPECGRRLPAPEMSVEDDQ